MRRSMLWGVFWGMLLSGGMAQSEQAVLPETGGQLEVMDYSGLLGMKGFSDALLKSHFRLYEGYVKNTNNLAEKIGELLTDGGDRSPEYAELKRRLGWELDGMLLHEYYFENLGGQKSIDPKSPLYREIVKNFGGFDEWKKDFVSTGLMRGIGWVVLCWEPRTRKLMNVWINEHDVGHIAGARPLLVMDVFEHAYLNDYQLDRTAYIGSFFSNINWKTVTERYGNV